MSKKVKEVQTHITSDAQWKDVVKESPIIGAPLMCSFSSTYDCCLDLPLFTSPHLLMITFMLATVILVADQMRPQY